MTKENIIRLRDMAEQTRVQFFDKRTGNAERKERVTRDNKFDNAELIAMLMENGQTHPDSMPVNGTSIKDLDENTLRDYCSTGSVVILNGSSCQ